MVHVAWGAGSKLRVFFICAKLWNPFYETLRWKSFFSRHRLLAIMLPPLNENCSAQLEGKQKDLCCTYGSRKQCGFYFSSPRNKSWELASFLEKAFIMATFKILMMTRRWPKTGEGEIGREGGQTNSADCKLATTLIATTIVFAIIVILVVTMIVKIVCQLSPIHEICLKKYPRPQFLRQKKYAKNAYFAAFADLRQKCVTGLK